MARISKMKNLITEEKVAADTICFTLRLSSILKTAGLSLIAQQWLWVLFRHWLFTKSFSQEYLYIGRNDET